MHLSAWKFLKYCLTMYGAVWSYSVYFTTGAAWRPFKYSLEMHGSAWKPLKYCLKMHGATG